MSYTPTEWVNGDTITAEKLNKIEQGIADNRGKWPMFIVTRTHGASYSLNLFDWGIAEYSDGTYKLLRSYSSYQYCAVGNYTFLYTAPYPIPLSENLFLVALNYNSGYDIVSQSGIDPTPISIIGQNGITYQGYKVFDDYFMTISG